MTCKQDKVQWWPLQRRGARPVVGPPKKPMVRYHDLMYRADSWGRERGAVAEAEGYYRALALLLSAQS